MSRKKNNKRKEKIHNLRVQRGEGTRKGVRIKKQDWQSQNKTRGRM